MVHFEFGRDGFGPGASATYPLPYATVVERLFLPH
jgi:hypothetical protein